jgi:putative ABC transport system permease protein
MEIKEGILLALTQIYHEKLKSAFTLLGVIIGVMFLIVVVSVVEGIDRYVTEDLAQQIFGVNGAVDHLGLYSSAGRLRFTGL